MNCPKCHGKAWIPMYRLDNAKIMGSMASYLVKCDYEGCVHGIVNCCDGLQVNQERSNEDNNM
jgi:hypothetical protein